MVVPDDVKRASDLVFAWVDLIRWRENVDQASDTTLNSEVCL